MKGLSPVQSTFPVRTDFISDTPVILIDGCSLLDRLSLTIPGFFTQFVEIRGGLPAQQLFGLAAAENGSAGVLLVQPRVGKLWQGPNHVLVPLHGRLGV